MLQHIVLLLTTGFPIRPYGASPSPERERGGLHYHSRMAGITSLPNSSIERMVASWDIRDSWP